MYKRVQYQTITKRLKEPRHFLQVVLGPRQVGKTTVIKQVVNDLNLPYQIYSADSIPATQTSWISDCWNTARVQMRVEKLSEFILIIDEIQKVPELFSYLQEIADDAKEMGKIILTGSSQFTLRSGISQSLAGRIGYLELLPLAISEIKKRKDRKIF